MKNIRLILATIFVIFGLLFLNQWLGIITIYFMPIPFVIFGYHQGLKKGLMFTIVTSFLAIILSNPIDYFLVLLGGTVGSVMGTLYRRKNLLPPIVGGLITALLNFILLLFFIRIILHIDIVAYMRKVLILEPLQLMQQLGAIDQQRDRYLQEMADMVGYTLPSMLIFASLFIVFIVHFISRFVFKALRIEIVTFPPLKNWTLPRSIFYYYVFAAILMAIPSVMDIYEMKLILLNLYPILRFLLIIQGISFALFYMSRKKWNAILKFAAIIGLVLFQVSAILPILDLLGLLDLGFNVRKKLTFRG
ncbi:DUF2232 domain-containing protein [Tepidibacillus fermentans]|uniref:Uncharacterized protein YybS (DUF2232 family) n=1 Tax=Tepidibacillus fermentans TaxID=1281767 RepID=A0A4R3KC51_9BACI|nr:DUF2232 domain-containing protein [Tepidibacillus fermentans]TCS80794.1 uncharacterized protein YybS (DUF2232 family) [Tepidibacillus fermentans]